MEHLRLTRAMDIGIQQSDTLSLLCQRNRQISRHG